MDQVTDLTPVVRWDRVGVKKGHGVMGRYILVVRVGLAWENVLSPIFWDPKLACAPSCFVLKKSGKRE
jgi:hypothetical protein